ncbi:lipoprotein, putative [Citrifermentans bemidjiense Bem]|uniref:Lipoprotein, putative n=1 Tax=Citrifermentans bemidjiense (strain ATCC BAA-1014 / DSM 16622 / JCM 12645 / Bem) TaxID=404380 RepID=B5E8I4_CITBB|nr:hypothetical protein [Citrifermentans bemidjiense]ACH38569.1 lipoprotein, putative [Citrifermentans bemidjiense Bem]
MFRKIAQLFCLASAIVALSSCGGGDLGGGIGEFATVNATAVPKTARLESDIVTGNACTTVSTGGTVKTDNVDVDFTSKPQFTTGALNLEVTRITIHYIPANPATPAIPDTFLNTNQTVAPGSTFTFTVPVLTEAQKTALLNRTTLPMPLCSSTVFEYYVDIIFETTEPGGIGKTRNITAKMNLAVADRT